MSKEEHFTKDDIEQLSAIGIGPAEDPPEVVRVKSRLQRLGAALLEGASQLGEGMAGCSPSACFIPYHQAYLRRGE